MPPPSRNTVGVYDRPHPLRTRKVVLPVLIAVVVVIGYAVYFLLRWAPRNHARSALCGAQRVRGCVELRIGVAQRSPQAFLDDGVIEREPEHLADRQAELM